MILTIIVTYNGEKYIEDCINSLLMQTQKTDILLVDNDSSDTTCKIVQKKYPQITIIHVGFNSGFAHANNIGIQYAIEKKYEYVMLLNEDTVADKKLVEELMKYVGRRTAVAPKIYKNGSLTKVWYAAGKMDFENGKAINCQNEFANRMTEVSFMTGCCMLVHTEIFREIGLFDENYYLYYEDTDLSLRMYIHNVRMLYVPNAYVWHRMMGRETKGYYAYYMERNRLFFVKKYANYFRCNIWNLIRNDLLQIIFKPDIYMAFMNEYRLRGIIDFLKNRMGKMPER